MTAKPLVFAPARERHPGRPAVTALQTYCDEYDMVTQLARGVRLDAATKLSELYDQISCESGHQNNPDQWVTLGDYVRGLYAVPDEMGRNTRGRLDGMDERIKRTLVRSSSTSERARRCHQCLALGVRLMSNSHHPRWRPLMANGRAGGPRTARGTDG